MPKSIIISRFGGPEVLQSIETPSPPLTRDSVRIQVEAAGVNFADLMMRMGLYPEAPKVPFVPGYEIAGTILEVGSEVKALKPGERVLAGTKFGGYTSEIVLQASQVRKIPQNLTSIEAASIPVNFLTAWVALEEMARVRKGDHVVIPSAAGGVGIAATQIAVAAGAKVTGLVSPAADSVPNPNSNSNSVPTSQPHPDKVQKLKALGATEVITYSEWEGRSSEKYSIILNAAGGKSLKQSFQKLTPGGRVVTYGASSVVSGNSRSLSKLTSLMLNTFLITPFKLMMENKGIFGLNLLKYFEDPAQLQLLNHSLDLILKRFEEGTFQTVVGKTFPLHQAGEAQAYLQSRENIGKVVLTP